MEISKAMGHIRNHMQNALYTLDLDYHDHEEKHGFKLIFDTNSHILLRDDAKKHLYVNVGATNYPTVPLHTALAGYFMHKAFYVDQTLTNVCAYKKQFLDCYADTGLEIKKLEIDDLHKSALPASTFVERVKMVFSYNNVNLDKQEMVMQQELVFLRFNLPLC